MSCVGRTRVSVFLLIAFATAVLSVFNCAGGCQMKQYICTTCHEPCFLSAEIEHMIEPCCPSCGGEIKEIEEDIHNEQI